VSQQELKAWRPRVGIIGGGQLARMTAEAAAELGVDIVILEREVDSPAGQIVGRANEIVGDWRDPAARRELAHRVDLITLENEFVDAAALEWFVARETPVLPAPATLRLIQDKLLQKQTLAAAGLPVATFHAVSSEAAAIEAGATLGWPYVLKARRLGYDGHGNLTIASPGEVPAAARSLGGAAGQPGPLDLYAEAFVRFGRELAVMVARRPNGETVTYPVVETVQRDHICHEVSCPADIAADVQDRARALATRAVEAVGAVGVVGVELFLLEDGVILVNELAPRPHNSGHYTIEGCRTSQFTNHLRGVLDCRLGSTELVAPACAMVNLLGTRNGEARPSNVDQAAAVPNAIVHFYGKRQVRLGRKMGHVTALGQSTDEAIATARYAARLIEWS
jgi:5-(carboxyamino)imidazole ribonucleotide synthase